LAALKTEDLDKYFSRDKFKNNNAIKMAEVAFRNFIPICITYEDGFSSFDPMVDENPWNGLALRILWSYFFDKEKLNWIDFMRMYRSNFSSFPFMSQTLDCISSHSNGKPLLLCVDEFMKASLHEGGDYWHVNKIICELGSQITNSAPEKLFVIVSTSNADVLDDIVTKLGRGINWIPLEPIKFSNAKELFTSVFKDIEELRREKLLSTS